MAQRYNSFPNGMVPQVQVKIYTDFVDIWASLTMVGPRWDSNIAEERKYNRAPKVNMVQSLLAQTPKAHGFKLLTQYMPPANDHNFAHPIGIDQVVSLPI
jgi:hypothetical protein